jgi:hypothetical protein
MQPGEDASYESQTIGGPEEREAMLRIEDICEFPIRAFSN